MEMQIRILQAIQEIRSDILTFFFTTITMMAEEIYITLFLAIFYWCIDKVKAIRISYILLFNSVFNSVIKGIVKMTRPFELGVVTPIRAETATGYSFPSGHTQTATSFWVGSMLVLKTRAIVILGTIMILLTAFSRMYLGVHWPMDVLGGIVFSLVFTYFAQETLNEKGEMKEWLVIISCIAMLIALCFNLDLAICKSIASFWGLCLGCYLEQKYVKFETKATSKQQVLKVIIGIVGILIIYIGMGKLLPQVKITKMIKYASVLLWIIVGAPWIFSKMKRKIV